MLPPFSWGEAATNWQFAPIVTAFTALVAAAYLWGVLRVRRRHPRRPWPLGRTIPFLLGLLVINLATQSGVGTYDDTLFWDHMIQHLMLIMIAPPLLVLGQPVTLLLHASRNPLHTRVKKLVRSRPVQWLTWPVFGVVAYCATIVGTHLTDFMNLVTEHDAVHEAEHVLYLVVGYLYFLPLIGKEPIRWKVSYPLRLFLLFIAMPVDAFTGVVLGSYQTDPFVPMDPRSWGPSAVNDLHEGGAVMWIGGAAIMFADDHGDVLPVDAGRPGRRCRWAGLSRRVGRAWQNGSPRRTPPGPRAPRWGTAWPAVPRGTPTSTRTTTSSRRTTSTSPASTAR